MSAAAVRERGILFSGPMVVALLKGLKTQTRRIVTPKPVQNGYAVAKGTEPDGIDGTPYPRGEICCHDDYLPPDAKLWKGDLLEAWRCPYGQPGDRLWVRETWQPWRDSFKSPWAIRFAADGEVCDFGGKRERDVLRWVNLELPDATLNNRQKRRPAIFLPRWASRLTLEIENVRVERLKAISEADARAEGMERPEFRISVRAGGVGTDEQIPVSFRGAFANGWDRINEKRAPWHSDPIVWAITFRVVQP